jgi:cellulose synthase/poly-beta-1,6-N-acetylglucosamine synthase-like glycosyltransferase
MKISILIPCYNGEKVIKKCIESCLNQTRKVNQIVVVNDGSTDNTKKILKSFGRKIKVISVRKNSGNKSYAQEKGLKHVKGNIFITIDSDSIMDKDFVFCVETAFKNPKTIAFSGYVKSLKHNWLTACREIDYVISQNIHKKAQSFINALFVIPGTAAAYRTKNFKAMCKFDHDTLTEDLDFTYKFHDSNATIKYDKNAIVYTQDPDTLHSYINQVRRWYAGGWQNLLKHIKIFKRPQNAFELSLIYLETLLFSSLAFLLPITNLKLYIALSAPLVLIMLTLTTYATIVDKRIDLLWYFPLYIFVVYINSYVFLEQFIKEVVIKKKNLIWFQPERRAFA